MIVMDSALGNNKFPCNNWKKVANYSATL